MWQEDSKMVSNNLYLLIFIPLLWTLECGQAYDLLLTSKIEQWWWDVISMIGLHKTVTSILARWLSLLPLRLHTLRSWAAMLERPTWQGIENGFWPKASMNWGSQSNSLQETEFYQEPHECRSRSFLGWTFKWNHSLWETLKEKIQRSCAQIHRNRETINVWILSH